MKKINLSGFLLYGNIEKDDFNSVRPMLWDRNIRVLLLTASLSTGLGALFLVINSIMMTGIWFPYLFLLIGSTLTLILLTVFHVTERKNEKLRMVMCYAQMILVCIYAGILSTQQSNYNTPATSVIVFIAILPLTIDDRPIRMFIVMFCAFKPRY